MEKHARPALRSHASSNLVAGRHAAPNRVESNPSTLRRSASGSVEVEPRRATRRTRAQRLRVLVRHLLVSGGKRFNPWTLRGALATGIRNPPSTSTLTSASLPHPHPRHLAHAPSAYPHIHIPHICIPRIHTPHPSTSPPSRVVRAPSQGPRRTTASRPPSSELRTHAQKNRTEPAPVLEKKGKLLSCAALFFSACRRRGAHGPQRGAPCPGSTREGKDQTRETERGLLAVRVT